MFEQGKSEGFESCDRPIIPKRPIWVKISDVLSRVTLKFDGWPWKTIGHLFYATSSSMHHFIAIGEFKLELQSGNVQFGSKSMIFFRCVTLQFDVWPCKTLGHLFYATSSFVCTAFGSHRWFQTGVRVRKRLIWVKIDDFLSSVTFKIWRMTLKINRAPLLRYFKLCASFRSHLCIQTGVTVRKRPIWVKFDDF